MTTHRFLNLIVFACALIAGSATWAAAADYLALSAQQRYELFAKLHERLASGEKPSKLEDAVPGLARNLKAAAKVSKDHWTDSTPFDELAKAYILSDKTLEALGIPHPMTGEVMHVPAGLMHTYGYLFAQLKTAFGLKGKRWIESRLDERLGLPAGAFSPYAPKGEFLKNVTDALFSAIKKKSPRLAGAVVEEVEWKTPKGAVKKAVVRTHLVDLAPLEGAPASEVKLLVYEKVEGGKSRLVTAFPIDQKFADAIQGTKPSIGNSFKPRFNLYVDPSWKTVKYENKGFVSR